MKCPQCDEEILLAEECPYCGASVPQTPQTNRPGGGEGDANVAGRDRSDPSDEEAGPASGSHASGDRASGASHRAGEHRGTFRGRISRGPDEQGYRGGHAYGPAGGRNSASLRDVWRFFTSDKVATWKKLSPLLLLLYFLSPLDFVPDVIPLLGWFDDATIAVVAWRWLASEIARHRAE